MPEQDHGAPNPADNELFLIDAMSLAYRSHYVFISRPLINSKGQNTSAAYGFTNSLLKLIEDHGIDHIAVVFDAVGEEGTFRDDIYEEYKAHRDPPPDELLENLPFIKDIVRALDIPVLEIPGVEADDVIGTLARRAEEDNADVVIVSPDKDFQQLLSENITIYKPARSGQEFDPLTPETFREEYELEPHQFIDMLALWGDSSDNVPGVPLIGEKTSAKLLREYDSVDNIIAHAEEVGGKRGQNLAEYADQARMSKRLVTIKTDVEVNFDWHELKQAHPNMEALRAIFEELEFDSFLERIAEMNGETLETAPPRAAAICPTRATARRKLTIPRCRSTSAHTKPWANWTRRRWTTPSSKTATSWKILRRRWRRKSRLRSTQRRPPPTRCGRRSWVSRSRGTRAKPATSRRRCRTAPRRRRCSIS